MLRLIISEVSGLTSPMPSVIAASEALRTPGCRAAIERPLRLDVVTPVESKVEMVKPWFATVLEGLLKSVI